MDWRTDPLEWAIEHLGDGKRNAKYEMYENYFNGDQPLAFATPKYAATFGNLFKAFSYNRCSWVVDAHADRLQIKGVRSVNAQVSERATELWVDNRMDQRAGEVHRQALMTGDGYVIVWPEAGGDIPQIWPQEAEHIRVAYDQERPGVVVFATKGWVTDDKRRRVNLYYPDRIEKWVSTRAVEKWVGGKVDYIPFEVPGETWPVANPWGIVPVFHFANNAETNSYGRSELCDVIPLQDALNKSLSDLILASELGGFPQKVILGLDADDEQVREGLRRLEGGMNKIFSIPFDADGMAPAITEFSSTNLAQLRDVVEMFDILIARASRVPVHYLQMSGSFPSGRAMRTAEGPFVTKIEDRMTAYGNVWEDAMALALRMSGVGDPGRLNAVWEEATALQDEDKWDLAMQKSDVGMPLNQILKEMGGYEEEEIAKIVGEMAGLNTEADKLIAGVSGAQEQSPTLQGGRIGG